MGTALVFVGALVFFGIFRLYGFQVEDEGTLLFQLTRIVHGQFPYVDFGTGYTPGFFYVGAAVLHALGDSTTTLRPFLAVMNAASVAALHALGRRVAGTWIALIPALGWLAFLPVYRDFAAANVPYPAWFATAAWMALALALVRFATGGGVAPLVAAGVAAAAAFSVKPNAGAFGLAAGTWIVTLAARRLSRLDRVAGVVGSLVMLGGVWVAFGLAWWSVDAAIHLLPTSVLALTAAFLAGRLATDAHPRTSTALAALIAGFVPVTLVWVVPVFARLGLAGFARDVLLLGSPAAALYYLPHPAPQFYAAAIVAAAVGLALAGHAVRRGALTPLVPLVVGALGVVGLLVRTRQSGLMPESMATSIGFQVENAGYWLVPLANWGGLVWLLRRRAVPGSRADERAMSALVCLAICMYLQLYPRTDDFHLVIAMPLSAVLGAALLARVLGWWGAGPRIAGMPSRGVLAAGLTAVTTVVLLLRIAPMIGWLQDATRHSALLLDSPTVVARVPADTADDLTAFGLATSFLMRHTSEGERVFSFPALTGLLYAARRTSPVPHDYWYPGRPDHAEEEAMITGLRADPPRFIVTLNDGWNWFINSPAYFQTARAFAVERYVLVARFGRFDVLARRDLAPTITPERYQPTGPADAVIEPDLGRRRQATKRWMAALTVEEARSARIDDDPVTAMLRLRAIRDGGDIRTAGWLLAGYDHPHLRVRREALGAMFPVTDGFTAMRHRWANDVDPADLRRYVEPYFARARLLLTDAEPRARDFAAALLTLEAPGGS